jgi:hypothetical protein
MPVAKRTPRVRADRRWLTGTSEQLVIAVGRSEEDCDVGRGRRKADHRTGKLANQHIAEQDDYLAELADAGYITQFTPSALTKPRRSSTRT